MKEGGRWGGRRGWDKGREKGREEEGGERGGGGEGTHWFLYIHILHYSKLIPPSPFGVLTWWYLYVSWYMEIKD